MPMDMTAYMAELRDAAVLASAAGDWTTAENKLMAFWTALSTMPASQQKDGLQMQWDQSLEKLLRMIHGKLRGTTITRIPVEYLRPVDDLDYR